MFYGRKRKTSKKGAKRPYRRAAKRTGKSSAKYIANICKKVISRKAENKIWFDYATNVVIPTANLSVPVYRNLCPIVAQAVGKSNRTGNEITVKNGMIRGHINILPYNAITNPFPVPVYVKMWIVSAKGINTNLLSATTIASDFLDVINASIGLQGNMLDIDLTLNRDSWTLHAQRVVKIGAGFTNTTTNLPVSGGGYFDNSPMSVPFYFNFGKHLKTLKYDDSNPPYACINRNLFIVFQSVNADGSTPAGYTPAEFHYSTRVEYEDM